MAATFGFRTTITKSALVFPPKGVKLFSAQDIEAATGMPALNQPGARTDVLQERHSVAAAK